jgi:small subunit ribosomal protein S2
MIEFKDLLKAGVHFGHKSALWSPKMKPFIWGAKNKVHLIDVSKTAFLLEQSAKFLKKCAEDGGSVLWVGTKRPAREIIEKAGKTLKMPFVINRWVGGTLSNFEQIKKAITRLLHLRDVLKKSVAATHYTKKELVMISKEVGRLERNVGGIIDLSYPPAAIVIIDAKREASAVKEAMNVGIPIVSLVDTNTNPGEINFVIPGNDDSPRSISCIVDYLVASVEEGKKLHKENKDKVVTEEKRKPVTTSLPVKNAPEKKDAKSVKDAKEVKPKVTEKKAIAEKKVEAKPEPKKAVETKVVTKKEDTKKSDTEKIAASKTEIKKSKDKKESTKK